MADAPPVNGAKRTPKVPRALRQPRGAAIVAPHAALALDAHHQRFAQRLRPCPRVLAAYWAGQGSQRGIRSAGKLMQKLPYAQASLVSKIGFERPAFQRPRSALSSRVRLRLRAGGTSCRARRSGRSEPRSNPVPQRWSGSSGCASDGLLVRLLHIFWARRVTRAASCPSVPRSSRAMNQSVPWRARVAST